MTQEFRVINMNFKSRTAFSSCDSEIEMTNEFGFLAMHLRRFVAYWFVVPFTDNIQ